MIYKDAYGTIIDIGDTVEIDGEQYTVTINDFTGDIIVDGDYGQEKLEYVHRMCRVIEK